MINLATMKRRDVPAYVEGITWVYVIAAGDPPVACKVGIAVDLYRRLKRTAYSFKGRAFPVGLHCAYAVPDDAPRRASYIESTVHGKLMRWAWGHPGGDWFLAWPEFGESTLRDVLARYGMLDLQRFPVSA